MPISSTDTLPLLEKKKIDLAHYHRKVRDLEVCQHAARSRRLRDWITLAKAETKQAMDQLREMDKRTSEFLTICRRQNKKCTAALQIRRDKYQARLLQFSGSRIMVFLRDPLAHYYEHALEQVKEQIAAETEAYQRVINRYPLCREQFRGILVELFCQPDQDFFHYKTVIGALNRLRSESLPCLKEPGRPRGLLPSVREKKFAPSEDKLRLYILQYRDAVRQYNSLGSAYIQELKSY
jgi:hypothetical protein